MKQAIAVDPCVMVDNNKPTLTVGQWYDIEDVDEETGEFYIVDDDGDYHCFDNNGEYLEIRPKSKICLNSQ